MLRGRSLIPLPSKQYRALQEEAVLRGGRSLNLYLLPQLPKDTVVITLTQLSMTHTHHMTAQETHESYHLDISYSHKPQTCVVEIPACAEAPGLPRTCVSTLVQGLSRSRKGKTFPGKNDSRWLGSGDDDTWAGRKREGTIERERDNHSHFPFHPPQ